MKTRTIDAAWVVLILAVLLLAGGCKTPATIARTDTVTKTVITERVRDTTVYLTDSAGFRALLECDSLGQVRIKQIQDYYAGQWVKPKVVIKDNYIKLDCKVDSAAVYVAWKERDTLMTQKINTVVVPPPVNFVTGWQWFQIWLGRLLMALVLLYVGFRLLKRYTALKLPF